jgi:hypothetical protein
MNETEELVHGDIFCAGCGNDVDKLFVQCDCPARCGRCCYGAVVAASYTSDSDTCTTCGKKFLLVDKIIIERNYKPIWLFAAGIIALGLTVFMIVGFGVIYDQQRPIIYSVPFDKFSELGAVLSVVVMCFYGVVIVCMTLTEAFSSKAAEKSLENAKIFMGFNLICFIYSLVAQIIGCITFYLLCGVWYPNFYTFGFGGACMLAVVVAIIVVCCIARFISFLRKCVDCVTSKENTVKTHVYELDTANNA